MNLTRLLATSRSLIGIKKKPGPYKMNQDHLLPKFTASAKPSGVAPQTPAVGESGAGETDRSDALSIVTVQKEEASSEVLPEPAPAIPKHSWTAGFFFRTMTNSLRRLNPLQGRRPPVPARATQPELSLATVRVVRNDLRDSDFQWTATKNGVEATWVRNGNSPKGRQLGMVWNRLSARLLRQAAQEFNLMQKQRGRLLSQAGHADPGHRGT